MPAGMFDRWYPQEVSQWIRIPEQLWEYLIWNQEAAQVEEVQEVWFEYINHFIARIKRSFVCSSGAERQDPCYGCAIRNDFYEEKRRIEEQTGVKEEKWAPISASRRYAFAMTSLEKVFAIPVRDKHGKIRRDRNEKIIYNFVPEPLAEIDDSMKTPKSQRGYNFHWSMGAEHLQQLADYDLAFQNTDAITGEDLLCFGVACASCEEVIHSFDDFLVKDDITDVRIKEMGCPHCGEKGNPIPLLKHPENPTFKQGSITAFDLRIKSVDIGNDKTALKIVDARVPQYTDEKLIALINNPLNIADIFAPTEMKFQQSTLGDMAKGVNPRNAILAKPYTKDDDKEGDINYGDGDGGSSKGSSDEDDENPFG